MMPGSTDSEQHPDIILPLHKDILQEEVINNVEIRFGYSIGYFKFVLEKTMITEVVIEPTIYPIPNSPLWLQGMINLRGNILPVIDLSETLSTSLKCTPGQYVLVVDKGSKALALLIDALPKSLADPVAADDIGKMTSIPHDYLSAGINAEGEHWMELDIKQLVQSMKQDRDAGQHAVALK